MSFAGDRDHAGHRRWRITRRADECHGVKKIRTVIPHARAGGRLASPLAAGPLVVAMIEPSLFRPPVARAGGALGRDARRGLTRCPAEQLPAVAGPAEAEHELTPPTALEAQLLVVVHRLLARRRETCPDDRTRALWAHAGVHRRRVSSCELGTLDLFGVLAAQDRNGEIFADATFPPTGSTVRTRRDQAAINKAPRPLARLRAPGALGEPRARSGSATGEARRPLPLDHRGRRADHAPDRAQTGSRARLAARRLVRRRRRPPRRHRRGERAAP